MLAAQLTSLGVNPIMSVVAEPRTLRRRWGIGLDKFKELYGFLPSPLHRLQFFLNGLIMVVHMIAMKSRRLRCCCCYNGRNRGLAGDRSGCPILRLI
jgi:hypothetical protein